MIVSVHQPQYIPWAGYFDKIAHSDAFVFLDTVQYKTREYQNRNKIRTPAGTLWLTVPVVSKGKGRQRICDVAVDNSIPWARRHLESLTVHYNTAPFFKTYKPFFEEIYSQRWERLIDLNIRIVTYCLQALSIQKPVYLESDLGTDTMSTDRIIQICKKLNADTYLSGAGGKEYLDEDKLAAASVRLVYQQFVHPVYQQQFMREGGDFIPFMSAIDLLFNEGPGARQILGLA